MLIVLFGTPNGTRTRILALKGLCPALLDDGSISLIYKYIISYIYKFVNNFFQLF